MARTKVEQNITYDDIRKKYYVTFYYGVDKDKKPIRKLKTFDTKKDAREALKEFSINKAKENIVNPKASTFEQYALYWLNDIKGVRCEETTLYGYKNIINKHLIPQLGKHKLQEIDAKILNRYFSKKLKEISSNTLKKHYDLLNDMFRIAINEDIVLKNPLSKVEKLKKVQPNRNIYDKEMVLKLLNIISNDTRMELIIIEACILGMRREEICGLTWDYVDLEKRELLIKNAITQAGSKTILKNAKSEDSVRTLYIPDILYNILIKIKTEQDNYMGIYESDYDKNKYVLSWEDGSHYRPNYISDLFKKTIDDNNLPSTRLHDLRHSFASIANDMGVPLYEISKALGHSDIKITSEIYTHLFDKTNKKAINKVADIFKNEKIAD